MLRSLCSSTTEGQIGQSTSDEVQFYPQLNFLAIIFFAFLRVVRFGELGQASLKNKVMKPEPEDKTKKTESTLVLR